MVEYKRYRDDTIDINSNSNLQQQMSITNWLNENVYKDNIKFTVEGNENPTQANFLDITVELKNGLLQTRTYSKTTDIHQYLNPETCHPPHVCISIPKSVAIRQRRNCSDEALYLECSREYKGYLLTSGYSEAEVDQEFAKQSTVNRKKLLQEKGKRRKQRKFRLVTNYEPVFSDIGAALRQDSQIFTTDEELKRIFPRGIRDFQVSYRRAAKNIKEILAPSKVRLYPSHDEEGAGSYPCGKNCALCPRLRHSQADHFRSSQTGNIYRVRQKITCETPNVVYLVTCQKVDCKAFQGVGQTKDLKKRVSNYCSHHLNRLRTCRITEHFIDDPHDFQSDFLLQPIVKLTNVAGLMEKQVRYRLEDFELYWQEHLCTLEPHGMNTVEEANKVRRRQQRLKNART